MPDGGAPIGELRPYFRGIDAALSLLERRLGAHAELDRATTLAELERYHRVVRESIAILEGAASDQPSPGVRP